MCECESASQVRFRRHTMVRQGKPAGRIRRLRRGWSPALYTVWWILARPYAAGAWRRSFWGVSGGAEALPCASTTEQEDHEEAKGARSGALPYRSPRSLRPNYGHLDRRREQTRVASPSGGGVASRLLLGVWPMMLGQARPTATHCRVAAWPNGGAGAAPAPWTCCR